jgi:hypothetical protein
MIAPHRYNRIKPPTQDRRRLSFICDISLSSPFSLKYNGSAVSSSFGNIAHGTFLASYSSPASLSSSGDFEIGSHQTYENGLKVQ